MRLTYTLFLTEEHKYIKTFDLLFFCLKPPNAWGTYTCSTTTFSLDRRT